MVGTEPKNNMSTEKGSEDDEDIEIVKTDKLQQYGGVSNVSYTCSEHSNPCSCHLKTLGGRTKSLGTDFEDRAEQSNESWVYHLCLRCRARELGPGWEPSFWPSVCPYPFCPSYRHSARTLSLLLLVTVAWVVAYAVAGPAASRGGQLYQLALLVVSAHLVGYGFRLCNLPGLVGMLLVGIVFQNVGIVGIEGPYLTLSSNLRKIALVNILIRAGLDLDPGVVKRMFGTTLRIGLVPWIVEYAVVVAGSFYLLHMPWMWCLLTGSIVSAVSPAVIVPGLLRLRAKGYGVAKGIPTVVIAISGIDDAASVAAFGILQSIMFNDNPLWYTIIIGPVSLLVGFGFGVVWGMLCKYVPEKGDPYMVTLRVLMLGGGGMLAVFGSELVHLEGAGPLGVVVAACVSAWLWSSQSDWHIEDNPVATAFEITWMVFEPTLFSLCGTQVKLNEIKPEDFKLILISLVIAFFLRMIATFLSSIGGKFNTKEKWFIAVSCMAKASVQAALAPVALDKVLSLGPGHETERNYAQLVLIFCVLSIVLTAPTGAIFIYFCGPRMLSKTTLPQPYTTEEKRPEEKAEENKKICSNISRKKSQTSKNLFVSQEKKDSIVYGSTTSS